MRRAATLAAGASVALLAEPLAGLVDTIAAGSLGVVSQGALAVGVSLLTVSTWLLSFLLFTVTTDVARGLRSSTPDQLARSVRSAAVLAVLLGGLIAVTLLVCSPWLLAAFGVAPELREPATEYIRVRALGVPLLALGYVGHGFLRGSSATGLSAAIAIGGALVDVAAVLALVRLTSSGLTGIAWATVASQALVVLALLVRIPTDVLRPGGGGSGLDLLAPAHLRVVLPMTLRGASIGGSLLLMSLAAGGMGPAVAAGHQVAYQVWIFAIVSMEGWRLAAQVLVAESSVADGPDAAVALARTLISWAVVLGIGAAAIAFVALAGVPRASADAESARVTSALWIPMALSLVPGAVAVTQDGIDFGLGTYWRCTLRAVAGGGIASAGAVVAMADGTMVWGWLGLLAGMTVRALLLVPSGRSRPGSRRGTGARQEARTRPWRRG